MSTARFALICTILVLLLFALSALGLGIIGLAVLAGITAILKDHKRLYFHYARKEIFGYVAYLFAVVMMVWTTISLVPRIEHLIPHGVQLPDPVPAAYWIHFALGSLFLMAALRPTNPNALPMSFTGSVVREQWILLSHAPQVIWQSLKRSIAMIAEAHWLKGLGGFALLILSVPVGIIAFTAGVLAVYWLAVLWAGMSAIVVIPLWLGFKVVHRKGLQKLCEGCGTEHFISGPGPLGFFRIRCRCGQRISIWRKDGGTKPSSESPNTLRWNQRPMQRGTLLLMIIGSVMMLLMVLRAYGLWSGPIRTVPWSREANREDAISPVGMAHQAPRPVAPAKAPNR